MFKYLREHPMLCRALQLGIGTLASSLAVIFIFGMGAQWGIHKAFDVQKNQKPSVDKASVRQVVEDVLEEHGLIDHSKNK